MTRDLSIRNHEFSVTDLRNKRLVGVLPIRAFFLIARNIEVLRRHSAVIPGD